MRANTHSRWILGLPLHGSLPTWLAAANAIPCTLDNTNRTPCNTLYRPLDSSPLPLPPCSCSSPSPSPSLPPFFPPSFSPSFLDFLAWSLLCCVLSRSTYNVTVLVKTSHAKQCLTVPYRAVQYPYNTLTAPLQYPTVPYSPLECLRVP